MQPLQLHCMCGSCLTHTSSSCHSMLSMHCMYAVIVSACKLWRGSVSTFRKMKNNLSTSALQRSHHCCHQGKTDKPQCIWCLHGQNVSPNMVDCSSFSCSASKSEVNLTAKGQAHDRLICQTPKVSRRVNTKYT